MLAQPFTKKTLIVALILAAALISLSFVSVSSTLASPLSDVAHYQYRLGEIAQMTHVDAQYQFRLGEIAQRAQTIDVLAAFRAGERAQYAQPVTSWIGSAAYYQYRQGEWFGN